jgi:serine protease Do
MLSKTHYLGRSLSVVVLAITLLILSTCTCGVDASPRRRTAVVEAVQAASSAIVNIHGPKTITSREGEEGAEETRQVNGMGTGVVIDPRGYIVTNHHVIEGVRRIQVTMWDGRSYVARHVARDPQTDLAVIKISTPNKLPLLRIGTSSDLMPGEPVIAVGNAFGYHNTVTRGIISALNRTVDVNEAQKYYDLIQTDASINPGNSGGPLLNVDGEMIGINVAVRVGAQGIGFAIPVDTAMDVAAKLIGKDLGAGTWDGLVGRSRRRGDGWEFVVRRVDAGSQSAKAGLRPGDVITSVNGVNVQRELDLHRSLIGLRAGQTIDVKARRSKAIADMSIELASSSRSDDPSRQLQGVESDAWRVLGVRLAKVSETDIGEMDASYHGGLRITSVRSEGMAARHGIRPGDILVGMHIWETASLEDLDYILNKAQLDKDDEIQFYVLRDNKTRVGQLPLLRR